jgi:hypothetical protein
MTPKERAEKLVRDEPICLFVGGNRYDSAEREICALLADVEEAEYRANAARCDRAGNTHGGTTDTVGALACRRVAAAIRARGEAR